MAASLLSIIIWANLLLIIPVTCQSPLTDNDGPANEDAAQFQANYPHDLGRISAGSAPVASAAPAFASAAPAAPTTPSAGVPSVMAPPTPFRGRSSQQLPAGRNRPNRITLVRQRTTDDDGTRARADSTGYQSASQAELIAQVAAERRQQAAAMMLNDQPSTNDDEPAAIPAAETPQFEQIAPPPSHQRQVAAHLRQQQSAPSIGSPLSALSAPQPSVASLSSQQLQGAYLQRPALQSAPVSDFSSGGEPAPAQSAQPFASAVAASQAQASASADLLEPLPAPSFEHVLGHGCPMKGVFSYDNKDHCDKYYLCTNGTFTEESCPNGLSYSQMGAVYHHCAYNWNVDCGRKKTQEPIASPGCPWQFGIFPVENNGRCSIEYYVCEWGVPETKRCTPEGLFYDDRIKGCQWADQMGCKSEAQLNFKCPPEDEDNPYWPYPRYYHSPRDIIVCVNEQPRLVHCTDEQAVEPGSLACIDLVKKKKKKF